MGPGGTIISVPTENIGSDRLGFTFTGDAAKSRISISLRLRASANTNTASVTCATVAPLSTIKIVFILTMTAVPVLRSGFLTEQGMTVSPWGENVPLTRLLAEPAECFGDNSYAACLPL